MILVYGGIFAASLLLFWYWTKDTKYGTKPVPGPMGLPFIGIIHKLGFYPEKAFIKWGWEYGDIYKVYIANKPTFVISDPKFVREIMHHPSFACRYLPWFTLYEDTPHIGLFRGAGPMWTFHRRFLLRSLHQLGLGKSSMESLQMEEVKGIISLWRQKIKAGKPIDGVRDAFRLAAVNGLWSILSSQRFDLDDKRLIEFADNTIQKFDDVIKKGALLFFVPWVRHIIPGLSGYTGLRKVFELNKAFFAKTVKEHIEKFEKTGEINDFIDVYLAEWKKEEDKPDSLFGVQWAERQLIVIMFDMFNAGSDTTATTLSWAIFYLCKFPEVKKRLQKEIAEITSGRRHVYLSDRNKMPYATATVDEILRYSSIVPYGLQRKCTEDTVVNGYFFPKECLVQGNLYFIHHHPRIWGDPENFRPERFINEDGKFVKNESLMPFLAGKRVCPGELLARDNTFLFLTNLAQNFDMEFDPNEKEPTFDTEPGFLRSPDNYSVKMMDRSPNIVEHN